MATVNEVYSEFESLVEEQKSRVECGADDMRKLSEELQRLVDEHVSYRTSAVKLLADVTTLAHR